MVTAHCSNVVVIVHAGQVALAVERCWPLVASQNQQSGVLSINDGFCRSGPGSHDGLMNRSVVRAIFDTTRNVHPFAEYNLDDGRDGFVAVFAGDDVPDNHGSSFLASYFQIRNNHHGDASCAGLKIAVPRLITRKQATGMETSRNTSPNGKARLNRQ